MIGNTSTKPRAKKNASDPYRLGHTYALVADTKASLLQTLAGSEDLAVHEVNRKGPKTRSGESSTLDSVGIDARFVVGTVREDTSG